MSARLRSWLTYSNVMATGAVFVALGGSSYAALRITGKDVPKNALTGADIKRLTGRDVVNNSLTGADVRNLTSADVADGRLRSKDFAPGQLPAGPQGIPGPKGDPGPAGAPATRLFAYVRFDDTPPSLELVYGSGVTGVERIGAGPDPGEFDVTFDRSLDDCVAQATVGLGLPRSDDEASLDANAAVMIDPGAQPNEARVFITNSNGLRVNSSFFITVFC